MFYTALVLGVEHFLHFNRETDQIFLLSVAIMVVCTFPSTTQRGANWYNFLRFISNSSHSSPCHMGHVYMIHHSHSHFTLIWYNDPGEWVKEWEMEWLLLIPHVDLLPREQYRLQCSEIKMRAKCAARHCTGCAHNGSFLWLKYLAE